MAGSLTTSSSRHISSPSHLMPSPSPHSSASQQGRTLPCTSCSLVSVWRSFRVTMVVLAAVWWVVENWRCTVEAQIATFWCGHLQHRWKTWYLRVATHTHSQVEFVDSLREGGREGESTSRLLMTYVLPLVCSFSSHFIQLWISSHNDAQ